MTLLEVISNAAASQERVNPQSGYTIDLSTDNILSNLKPKLENPNPGTLINPITGWEILGNEAKLMELGKSFSSKLKRKLKDTKSFGKDEFVTILKQFLEKIGEKVGIPMAEDTEIKEINILLEKTGFLMGRDVAALVLEGFVRLEMWELVKVLISKSMVDHSSYSYLVSSLVAKHQSDLLCDVIKHASDLGASELLLILKYFLSPSKEVVNSLVKVREEWDSQALVAIEKTRAGLSGAKSRVAEEALILLMLAHDGFSSSELCLHYLLASQNVDEVMLVSAVSKLSGNELSSLIRYLSKWLKKYERFPQAGPCPQGDSKLGLKLCNWVPKLEDVTKCLGIVIDENFSSLVLHKDLQEEFKSIARVADSLATESKLCCFIANVVEGLKLGAARN